MPQRLRLSTRRLGPKFFARGAEAVARDLIGTVLVRRLGKKFIRARIVETEAYVGAHDLACHAAKGRTARTEVMFGPPGHAYVYFIYGMYDMLNVVTAKRDDPQAVLIRALEPVTPGWAASMNGPGKLTRSLHITRQLNGLNLCKSSELFLEAGAPVGKITVTERIGVEYAKEWKNAPLRFFESGNPNVSRLELCRRPKRLRMMECVSQLS